MHSSASDTQGDEDASNSHLVLGVLAVGHEERDNALQLPPQPVSNRPANTRNSLDIGPDLVGIFSRLDV